MNPCLKIQARVDLTFYHGEQSYVRPQDLDK